MNKKLTCLHFVALCTFLACTSSSQQGETLQSDQNEQAEEYKTTNSQTIDDTLPHPRSATAWDTNLYIVGAQKRPSADQINSCIAETLGMTADATNDYTMIQAKNEFAISVEEKEEFYHWCFYSMMNALDIKMDEEVLTFEKRKSVFFKYMRAAWLLAQTLDDIRGVKIYFPFLRERYMDISKVYFGRELEVVNAPFSGYKTQVKQIDSKKPADGDDDELEE